MESLLSGDTASFQGQLSLTTKCFCTPIHIAKTNLVIEPIYLVLQDLRKHLPKMSACVLCADSILVFTPTFLPHCTTHTKLTLKLFYTHVDDYNTFDLHIS